MIVGNFRGGGGGGGGGGVGGGGGGGGGGGRGDPLVPHPVNKSLQVYLLLCQILLHILVEEIQWIASLKPHTQVRV